MLDRIRHLFSRDQAEHDAFVQWWVRETPNDVTPTIPSSFGKTPSSASGAKLESTVRSANGSDAYVARVGVWMGEFGKEALWRTPRRWFS